MMKLMKRSLILVVVALGLSACGVRSGLESPPEDVAANRTDSTKPNAPNKHKPFILDGLIR